MRVLSKYKGKVWTEHRLSWSRLSQGEAGRLFVGLLRAASPKSSQAFIV